MRLLVADDDPDMRQSMRLQAGFDDHLVKPVEPGVLRAALQVARGKETPAL